VNNTVTIIIFLNTLTIIILSKLPYDQICYIYQLFIGFTDLFDLIFVLLLYVILCLH